MRVSSNGKIEASKPFDTSSILVACAKTTVNQSLISIAQLNRAAVFETVYCVGLSPTGDTTVT